MRSQDRLSLLKPFDLELMPCLKTPDSDYDTTDFRAYLSKSEDDYVILGTYKTKERALEVLDEIQDLMRSLGDSDLKIIQYEMPKE